MCIISNKIINVSNTTIFVAPNIHKNTQITIISNFVNNVTKNNVFILPVPNIGEVRLISMNKYLDFFDDCDKHFSNISQNLIQHDKVVRYAEYEVSYTKNFSDLLLLKIFDLTEETEMFFKNNYDNANWGFIICKMAVGAKIYYPLAFSHSIINNKIFVPTMQHRIYDTQNTIFENKPPEKDLVNWDIELYVLNCNKNGEAESMRHNNFCWNKHFNIIKKDILFSFDYTKNFEKLRLSGWNKNMDLVFTIMT